MRHVVATRSERSKVKWLTDVVVLVPRIVGGVLILAGGLKAYQLLSEPFTPTWIVRTEAIAYVLVALEWAIGSWVIYGVQSRVGRLFVAALFAAFFVVNINHVLSGAISCGCFGAVKISPWITASFDLASAGLFTFLACKSGVTSSPIRHDLKVIAGPLLVSLIAVSAVWWFSGTKSPTGITLRSDGSVLLEPDQWLGQRFELANDLRLPPSRVSGRWLVVIHRYGCAACEHVEETLQTSAERRRTIWLEVPSEVPLPLAQSMLPAASDTRRQLPANRTWHVQTPVAIAVHNGRVVGVTRDAEQMLIWANDAEQDVDSGAN